MKNNKKIVLEVVKQNGMALEYASKKLQNNYNIVKIAVYNKPHILVYASNKLRKNKKIALIAISQNIKCFYILSELLKKNLKFLVEVYFICPEFKELEEIKKNKLFWLIVSKKTNK